MQAGCDAMFVSVLVAHVMYCLLQCHKSELLDHTQAFCTAATPAGYMTQLTGFDLSCS